MKKIIIALLLSVLIISGCKSTKPQEPETPVPVKEADASYYVEQLREFKPGTKNPGNKTANKDFDEFLQGVFEEKVGDYFLEFHYNIYDYRKMGLEKPEVTLGEYKYELNEEEVAYHTDLLKELRSYDYTTLSYDQQYDYDCLEFDTLCRLADLYFYKYNFLLKAGQGVPDSLSSYFTDYTFYDEESVVDYLKCISEVPRVYDEVLTYTEKQAKDGYPMLDEWIDYYKELCTSFIDTGEKNDLITSFDRRIADVEGISEEKKTEYIKQNKDLILNELVPAHQKLKEQVEQYRGKTKVEDYRYCNMDKDYADYMYMAKGSSSYTAQEMLTILTDALSLLEAEYMSAIEQEEPFQKTIDAVEGKYEIFTQENAETLAYLAQHINEYFPETEEIKYTVEYLDPETAPETLAAYYWQAPIDNDEQNIIRVNPNNKDPLTYRPYGTMAHEGMPGHMYQIIYYHRQDPSKFRLLLFNNLAYLEGWAEYSSYYGYRMAGLNDDLTASVMFYDANSYFLEYSIIDIMTNYFGYTAQEICDFFTENSIFAQDVDYYEMAQKVFTEYSGQYFPYGFGMSFLFDLREDVSSKLGDSFDYVAFHKAILDSGIAPMNVLKESVYEKLNIKQ